MKNKGITLIELLVVVAIVGVLVIALGFSYVGWMGRYKIESTVKQLYSDLMDARTKAMQRNRDYFADFNLPAPPAGLGRYRIIQDTNDNGTSNPGAGDDMLNATFPKTVGYAINWNGGGTIKFDKRGIISPDGTINFTLPANVDPDYDCIVIFSSTRINMGKMSGGVCNAK
jgi:prepilin-type N-terminal cleavage/methylation domain-containing protein